MKVDLPISAIKRLVYLEEYLFLSNSRSLGFIDFGEHAGVKEYTPVDINVASYWIVQPILIKNYDSGKRGRESQSDLFQRNFSSPNAKKVFMRKILRDYSLYFNDTFYDKAESFSKDNMSTRKQLHSDQKHANIFYFALKGNQVDVYSQHKLYKSISINLLRFGSGRKGSATPGYIKRLSKQAPQSADEQTETSDSQRAKLVSTNAEVKSAYFKCVFEKHGSFWSYSESMPDFVFVVVHDCDEFLNEIIKERESNKTNRNWLYEKKVFGKIISNLKKSRHKRKEQSKILTFEVVSNQVLSVQLVGDNKNALDSPGQLRFFRNFRNLIVMVFVTKPDGESKAPARVRVLVKQFDKYNGFKSVYDKRLEFSECDRPFYDILYRFKRNQGRTDLEKTRGRYYYFRDAQSEGTRVSC